MCFFGILYSQLVLYSEPVAVARSSLIFVMVMEMESVLFHT